ncbi:MAG: hypothetical protein HKN71_12075 [Gemmatimonadetes bacterium]|nr:hypothetical protein [Gemmatimonadota bacterium]
MFEPTRAIAALSSLIMVVGAVSACGGDESMETDASEAAAPETAVMASGPITVAGVGFATPESVLHDTVDDVYLVSNINGNPLDKDGNGFISRLSPDGEVLDLKWIDGEAEGVELSAPKGMAIQGDQLYVTDVDCVRVFDRATGAPQGGVCVDGASFLNDLTPHPEAGVIFTDMGRDAAFEPTGTDAVYHLMGDAYAPIVADAGLGGPNGVTMRGDELVLVSYFSGEVYSVSADGAELWFPALEGAQLDGVEALDDGRLLVSDWGSNCVLVIDAEGRGPCIVENVEAPADIGIDRTRNQVLVPLFMADEVWIRPIG